MNFDAELEWGLLFLDKIRRKTEDEKIKFSLLVHWDGAM